MRVSSILAVVVSSSIPVWAVAAGSHSGGHGAANGQPGTMANVDRTVQVEMHDNYYEPENIDVSEGETIRFVVENRGNLVHEFNIGTPSMHEAHQDEMQMMVEHGVIQGGQLNHGMMNMDMGNGHSMKHDHANSVLLEPGQSKEIIWKFSNEANIEYACNVPGHYKTGMYGEVYFD